jgi:hypothetical protein
VSPIVSRDLTAAPIRRELDSACLEDDFIRALGEIMSRNLLLAGTSAPGGGGHGGNRGGDGGAGFSGGGGGSGDGGGGGGSYLSRAFTSQYLFSGSNSGDGHISIMEFTGATVLEPSTWAVTLAGFAGLGWLARLRKRKTECA